MRNGSTILFSMFLILPCACAAGVVGIINDGEISGSQIAKKYKEVEFNESSLIVLGGLMVWPKKGVLITQIYEGEDDAEGGAKGPVNFVGLQWQADAQSAQCSTIFTKSKGDAWFSKKYSAEKFVKYDAALEWSYAALRGSTLIKAYPLIASRLGASWLTLSRNIKTLSNPDKGVVAAYFSFRPHGERESYHYISSVAKNFRVQSSCRIDVPFDDETVLYLFERIGIKLID